MLTLEEIRERLKDRNLKKVSEHLDMHYATLTRIANGGITNPTYETVEKISNYLETSK